MTVVLQSSGYGPCSSVLIFFFSYLYLLLRENFSYLFFFLILIYGKVGILQAIFFFITYLNLEVEIWVEHNELK